MYNIYIIFNKINTKGYVGITANPVRRWKNHQNGNTSIVSSAIKKYGSDSFIFDVLYSGIKDELTALALEAKCIADYQTHCSLNGYNILLSSGGRTVINGLLECVECGDEKPCSFFRLDDRSACGFRTCCKPCEAKKKRELYQNDPVLREKLRLLAAERYKKARKQYLATTAAKKRFEKQALRKERLARLAALVAKSKAAATTRRRKVVKELGDSLETDDFPTDFVTVKDDVK